MTLPSTLHQPPAVRRINRVLRLLNAAGLARTGLSADALLDEARRQTRLDDYGDERFLPAMRAFLDSLERDAGLNPFGRRQVRHRTLATLRNRLWAQACFERHPEIRRRKIAAPVVIVGLARSGTTRLQRLLAADPQLQYLRAWEGYNYAPRPGGPGGDRQARRDEVDRFLARGRQLMPEAFVAHPLHADWAEEEMLLLDHSFCGLTTFGPYHVPGFVEWFHAHDRRFAYEYLADQLRLVSWARSTPEESRWLLKAPQHLLDLQALLSVFPDAHLVFTHRDPLKAVGSIASLMWNFGRLNTDMPLRRRCGRTWLDLCERMVARAEADRAAIPATRQLDVHYHEVGRDWLGEVRRIYRFAGLPLPPATHAALERQNATIEREARHAGHRYSLEEFGLTAEEVEARLGAYRERRAIPREEA